MTPRGRSSPANTILRDIWPNLFARYVPRVFSKRIAVLARSGLVGAAEMAVGHRPPGTQYGYHVDVQFTDNSGKGQRVEGRPCTITFAKKSG